MPQNFQQLSLFDMGLETEPEAPKVEIDKVALLTEIASECAACNRCELHQGRTHSVFADGNPDAKIMIIGEGPGRNEDEQGLPFVGKAGQLLDKILASVGLVREKDVYICNIVKCRPPNNRTPTKEEMEACLPYLEKQLALIQPQIIILAGSTAIKGLLKDSRSISRIRGQWIEWKNIWVMPIFHPAYLLRNESRNVGSPKWLTWQDIKAVQQKYEEIQSL